MFAVTESPTWMQDAECVGLPAFWWDGEDDYVTAVALTVCEDCPVRDECLQDALASGETWTIRGGVNMNRRKSENDKQQ